MPTVDLLNQSASIPPNDNIEAARESLTKFQNKFNNLDSQIQQAIIGTQPPKTPSGIKVPGKIFDPVFGINVLFGYVITSDFMSFCDYKPMARVGDLVFVVGIVGVTVVAELGVITSGCMDVRNNSFGSGAPSTGGLGGCVGSPLFSASINADFLNPSILSGIDNCVNSGDFANCLPDLIKNILGACHENQPQLSYGAADSFHLDNALRKFGIDHVTRLNNKLKKGFCGNSPVDKLKFLPNGLISKPSDPTDPCNIQTNNIASTPLGNVSAQCVSEHMKYLTSKLQDKSGVTFSDTATGYMSKQDVEVVSLTQDIKNFFDKKIGEEAQRVLSGLPSEYPSNSAEAINLALEAANFVGNKQSTVSSISSIVNEMKNLRKKIEDFASKPVDSVISFVENDPELKRFFGELVNERQNSLESLKPPPSEFAKVCPEPVVDENCADLNELQKMVNDGIKDILDLINGKLISQALSKAGVGNLKIATGAAGMNPIDSMTLWRSATLDKIRKSIAQTLKVKAYLEYSEATSMSLIGDWGTFDAVFAGSPRDIFGNITNTAPLTSILSEIENKCVTLPQQAIQEFALEIQQLGSDIRQFNFVSMDPDVVGTSPPLATMLANPAVLVPSSNIGAIVASSAAAIQQAYQNVLLIQQQLSTVIPSKEQALAEMEAYANNVVQMGIDSLKSLQGCLPPLPCIDFKGLFNFDTAFNLGIGNPFKINIPVLDLSFPDFNFKFPIVFPTLIAPTGFRAAVNVSIPQIKFPRIPTPPLFPPNFTLPTLRLPQLNIPFNLSKLNALIPKFPRAAFTLPLPQIKLPRFPAIIIPPITIKLPKFNMRFGGFPFPKLDITLPRFPINFNIQVPLTFDIKIPIPSIDIKLPHIALPFIKIPKFILNIPKLNIPVVGGLTVGTPSLDKISIPFPAITIPSLCGDQGKTIDELIADGKNTFNRLMNMGVSGGRPLAVANCSLWVSPHFRGWIAPIPCSAVATDFSKCACAT